MGTTASSIHQGAVAPYKFLYMLSSPDPVEFDLSTIVSARFEVIRDNMDPTAPILWTASFDNQTPSSMRLIHAFVAGDVDEPGILTILPLVSDGVNEWPGTPVRLAVRKKFG
jgi:hypothetical protein